MVNLLSPDPSETSEQCTFCQSRGENYWLKGQGRFVLTQPRKREIHLPAELGFGRHRNGWRDSQIVAHKVMEKVGPKYVNHLLRRSVFHSTITTFLLSYTKFEAAPIACTDKDVPGSRPLIAKLSGGLYPLLLSQVVMLLGLLCWI